MLFRSEGSMTTGRDVEDIIVPALGKDPAVVRQFRDVALTLPPPDSPAQVLRAALTEYLYLDDDPCVVDVVLATVVANMESAGDPLWLLLVGPPGTAKTELVQLFRTVPECGWLSELTENTLLSGLQRPTKGGRSVTAREYSLLFRWTDPKLRGNKAPIRVMLIQDVTGLVTARREKRDAIFGQLRQRSEERRVGKECRL